MLKIFTFYFLFTGVCFAAADWKLFDPQSPKWILQYADALADSGDYYRAISEYKRALFYYPEYEKKNWVRLQIGRMYFLGGRHEQAKNELIPLSTDSDKSLQFFSLNWLAMSYFENQEYINAKRLFTDLLPLDETKTRHQDYHIHIGLSHAFLGEYNDALQTLKKAALFNQQVSNPDYNKFYQHAEKLIQTAGEQSRKSPFLALILGIVPGLGNLYLGKWDNALISLALVASTAYLTYDGYIKDNNVQMGIFAGLASGFYVGSIYSGYQGAYKHNATLGEADMKELGSLFRNFKIKLSANL